MKVRLNVKQIVKWSVTLACLIVVLNSKAQCDSVAKRSPTVALSKPFSGSSFAFSNPLNVLPYSNSFASATALLTLLSGKSEFLQAKGFGFNLPANAIICGIEAKITESADGINILSVVTDDKVQLLNGGVATGASLAKPDWWETSPLLKTYGGTGNLWGRTWTVAEINSADFGVGVSAQMTGLLSLLPTAKIHSVEISVNYSLAVTLPIHVKRFYQSNANNKADLHWEMEGISSGSSVLLQRSTDANQWTTIYQTNYGELLAASVSAGFIDEDPLPGRSFYRLKIVNADNAITYGGTINHSNNKDVNKLQLYPIPATEQITIVAPQLSTVNVYNVFGQIVSSIKNISGNMQTLDISHYPKGTYIVSTKESTVRFIKY